MDQRWMARVSEIKTDRADPARDYAWPTRLRQRQEPCPSRELISEGPHQRRINGMIKLPTTSISHEIRTRAHDELLVQWEIDLGPACGEAWQVHQSAPRIRWSRNANRISTPFASSVPEEQAN
ncbi:hypothetical protein F1880_006971 [Penicillium rolfsii]|nr:hypothetical protein F1880_006971 [Penicillium rolfsii]